MVKQIRDRQFVVFFRCLSVFGCYFWQDVWEQIQFGNKRKSIEEKSIDFVFYD
jgi:hypothetical protein